jgi:hypothetical protein
MRKRQNLSELYHFPGFRPRKTVNGIFGDSNARVIKLSRRGKKLFAASAVQLIGPLVIVETVWSATYPVVTPGSISNWRFAASNVAGVAQ